MNYCLRRIKLLILIIIQVFIMASCHTEPENNNQKTELSDEQLADINRQLMIKDRERIISYINRKGLEMEETESGLWISSGLEQRVSIEEGDLVSIEYTCSLLDGTLLYDSSNQGLMKFEVGKSEIPAGLNEGIKLLTEGSKATLILPAYLGYGLLGDDSRIPARAILVYAIEVVSVN